MTQQSQVPLQCSGNPVVIIVTVQPKLTNMSVKMEAFSLKWHHETQQVTASALTIITYCVTSITEQFEAY